MRVGVRQWLFVHGVFYPVSGCPRHSDIAEARNGPSPPTSALGDWYVNLVQIGRQQVVLATSERSLLSVLFPARGLRQTLVLNLQAASGQPCNWCRKAITRGIVAPVSRVKIGRR